MIRFKTTLQKFDSKLWGHHFPIAADIAENFIEGNDRRVLCTVNGLHTIQSALMPYPDGFFILINVNVVKKLNLSVGEEVTVQLEKDTSEYGLPMPESFRALLEQDEVGNGFFEQLSPGKKRTLIYVVGNVKNIDSQLNKGLAILDHLKFEQGKLDFRKLNQLIKEYNQRSKLK